MDTTKAWTSWSSAGLWSAFEACVERAELGEKPLGGRVTAEKKVNAAVVTAVWTGQQHQERDGGCWVDRKEHKSTHL